MTAPRPGASALARGGAAGIATLAVERGAALVLVAFLARRLDADAYGRVSFVIAYLSVFQILADLGLESVLLRRLAQDREKGGGLLAAALALRLALATAAAGAASALVGWVAPGPGRLALLVALGAPAFLWAAQPGLRALFRAEGRLDEVLRVASAGAVATVVLSAAAVLAGGGPAAVLAAMSAAQLAAFALAALRASGRFPVRLRVALRTWRSLLGEAWPIGLNLLVAVAGLRIAPILLMSLRGPVEVGAFASAARLSEATNLVADGVMLAVFPVLARLHAVQPVHLAELAALVARWLAVAFLCLALFLSEAAADVVTLVFGAELVAAAPVLAVLGWNAVLSALGTLYASLLVVVGRQRVLLGLNAVSALAQVLLQVPLIARFGLHGAAAGVLVGAAVNHVVLRLLPASGAEVRACFAAVLPPILAAAFLLALSPVLPLGPWARAILLPGMLAGGYAAVRLRADRAALERLVGDTRPR